MKLLPSRLPACGVALALCAASFAQAPTPAPVVDEEDVVRITANLVQLDAVVTDKSGKQVTDLRAEDFEVFEDGKPQPITNLSYVSLDARAPTRPTVNAAAPASPAAPAAPAPAAPPALRPGQVHRTLALVIDDLGLSFESMAQVRAALRKYVDEQMQPNDLVAIIRTSAGMGALQQFTNDKRILYAAIERIKWYPLGRGGVSAFAPVAPDPVAEANQMAGVMRTLSGRDSLPTAPGVDQTRATTDPLREVGNDIEAYREEIFSVGTLGALNYVVKGLRELPGRKSAILFSDGISILKRDAKSERVLESMRRLVDLANRASVVIYTMDARGLSTLTPTAQDNFQGRSGQEIRKAIDDRTAGYFESKNGLNYLARQTGGIFFENDNNLAGGVRRALDDQRGFYLVGYRPDPSTFDATTGRRSFHQVDVRVRRPGLSVRTRNGFYGFTDEEAKPARAGREQQLYGALSSPFAAGTVGLRLTSLYGHDAQTGAFLRSLLYVDGHDLTFQQQPDGTYRSELDMLALTFGDTGRALDEYNATLTWTGDARAHQNVLRGGLVYVVNVPVKKPGPYQLRVAVRDAATEHVGSANQFVEVPDLTEGRLTLSGLVLSGTDEAQAAGQTVAAKDEHAAGGQAPAAGAQLPAGVPPPPEATELQAGPALRRLRPGMALYYNFAVYNAQGDAGHPPQLSMQARLYRDGQLVYTGQPLSVDTTGQTDAKHLLAGGRMKLGANAAPGAYVLQIAVTDARARDRKHATAAQWLDFEIAR
ncbi:MAG TPA: VWA domain-containing protein [Pyrinomonadaceae bacterium]|jgi:VWFA-related protein